MSSVLIIGAGVIGLSLARELDRQGFGEITVLERGEAGREASFAAAGMLAPQAETDRDDAFFRFCAASAALYPETAGELLDETGIDLELDRSGTLYLAFDEADVAEIRRRYRWQREAGLEVEHLSARETHRLEPFVSPDSLESLFFPNDWQIENRKLLAALLEYARRAGIRLVERTAVAELAVGNGRATGALSADGRRFRADAVVLATGAWTSLIKGAGLKLPEIRPVRGQMVSFHTAKRLFTRTIYSPRGYLVPRRLGRILAGATVEDAGFEDETTPAGIELVRENAYEIAPALSGLPVDEKWSGLRPFAADGLPVIGAVPEADNLFVATAHYRNGILLAPLTARILAARITGEKDSEFLRAFGPLRFNAVNAG